MSFHLIYWLTLSLDQIRIYHGFTYIAPNHRCLSLKLLLIGVQYIKLETTKFPNK